MKQRSKVIATSIATIAMCASLAVGGTYALFTSESEVNIAVTAGTVDVRAIASELTLYSKGVEQAGNTFEVGGTATKEDNKITIDRMVPMDSLKFDIAIENYSDVNVQYRTVISVVEDTGLFSALTVTFTENGTAQVFNGGYAYADWKPFNEASDNDPTTKDDVKTINVEIAFPDGEDQNVYQGKSCEIMVTVEAVQGNADVVNPVDYIDGVYYVNNEEGMMLMNGIINSTTHTEDREVEFALTANMDMTGYAWIPLEMQWVNVNGQGYTVSNLNCVGMNNNEQSGFAAALGGGKLYDITFENFTVVGQQAGIICGNYRGAKKVEVTIAGKNTVTHGVRVSEAETWDAIGAVIGTISEGSFDGKSVTFAEGATVVVDYSGMITGYSACVSKYCFSKDISEQVVGATENTVTTTGEWGTYLADGLYLMSDGTYKITNENGLVKAGAEYFSKGGTFNLANDITLGDDLWTPAKIGANFTFNGNDNTIYNLTVADPAGSTNGMGAYSFLLSSNVEGDVTTIKNVTFDGASITGNNQSNANMAVVMTTTGQIVASTLKMEKVTVQNSVLQNGDRTGGLLSYGDGKAKIEMIDCASNNNTIKSNGTAGALIAYAICDTATINGFTAQNNTIYSREGASKAGLVIGTLAGNITVTVNDLDKAIEGSIAWNQLDETKEPTYVAEDYVQSNNFAGRYVSGTTKINDDYYVVRGTDLGSSYVTYAENYLQGILNGSETEINILLGNGNYMNKFTASNKTINVTGDNGAVIGITKDLTAGVQTHEHLALSGCTVTFNGVKILFEDGGYYSAFTHYTEITYNNCTITGQFYTYGKTNFIGCTFDNDDEAAMTAMRYTYVYGGDVLVDGCTFLTRGHALIMFSDNNTVSRTLTVRNSKFKALESGRNASGITNQWTAGIEIDSTYTSYTLKLEGTNTVEGDYFSGLWRIKTMNNNVTVNDTTYTKDMGDTFVEGEAYTKTSIGNNQYTVAKKENA